MKIAGVFSGGGANGAWQAGVITSLAERGISFDVLAGVSVGSLNGAMLAQGSLNDLIRVWETVTEDRVYRRPKILGSEYLGIAWRLLVQKKNSIYSAAPLLEYIQEKIHLQGSYIPFYVGFTSLVDGRYYTYSQNDFLNNSDYQNAIYASSVMPILWEPVAAVRTTKGVHLMATDGGLRDVTPLSAIIRELPDKIYIVSCNNGQVGYKDPRSIIDIAKRTFMDIMLSEVIVGDTEMLLKINDLVLQARDKGLELVNPKTGATYKYFDVEVIEPEAKLGDPIDFSRPRLDRLFKEGRAAGKK